MKQTILFKVPGKPSTSPVGILSALDLAGKSKTNHFRAATKMLSRALSKAWKWTRCNCTPVRIIRAIFSAKVSTVVAAIVVTAMWWHNITISNTIEAQEAVGFDGLLAMPWAIVWAIRATRMPMPEEGGQK